MGIQQPQLRARGVDVPAAAPPLSREFFARPTHEVARDLMGKLLWRRTDLGLCGGRIVETEAYGGPDDLASHARAGRTRRASIMYGEVGHAYVYLIYGMHECLNVVAYGDVEAGAVLLRALEPVAGIEAMRARRGRPADPASRLCSGPARLCQAMSVDRTLNGHDLTVDDQLWLSADPDQPAEDRAVASGPRIGVDYAGPDWAELPWRFWLFGHRSVSR